MSRGRFHVRVTRAVALLPVLPRDLATLEDCLEHLIEAADEASAAGIATTLLLTTSAPAAVTRPVLASWAPLVELLDDVALEVEHHPVPAGAPTAVADEVALLLARASDGLRARLDDPAATVVLTSTPDVAVGADWITEHVRHHRAGATASTGPVRRPGPADRSDGAGPDRHDPLANLAVRADLLPAGVLAALGRVPLVHALTPVVAGLPVTIRTGP